MSPPNPPIRPTRRRNRPCRRRALSAWGLATLTAFTTLGGAGCTTWNQRALPAGGVAPVVARDHPVRLTLRDSATLILTHPRVIGDSIVGEVRAYRERPQRTAVALTEVRQVDERSVSAGRTVALAGVAALALLIAWVGLAFGSLH